MMASDVLEERALRMIRKMTPAERALWDYAEANLDDLGWQLEPQAVLAGFIVDFWVESVLLAVEVDGAQHSEEQRRQRDEWRTHQIEATIPGATVIRFTNEDVLEDVYWVAERISAACQERWDRAAAWRDAERQETLRRQSVPGVRPQMREGFAYTVSRVLEAVYLDAWLLPERREAP